LHRRVIVLDGDEMRASISLEEGLSAEDRRRHNLRVARLAKVLQAQGCLVVVAVIAPFRSVREEIDTICAPRWLYVERSGLSAADRPYEPPLHPDAAICTDMGSVRENVRKFVELIKLFVQDKDLHQEKIRIVNSNILSEKTHAHTL
jgi:adenylylsulfate kinase-like enzyme